MHVTPSRSLSATELARLEIPDLDFPPTSDHGAFQTSEDPEIEAIVRRLVRESSESDSQGVQSAEAQRWSRYEELKRRLLSQDFNSDDYERAISMIARELDV